MNVESMVFDNQPKGTYGFHCVESDRYYRVCLMLHGPSMQAQQNDKPAHFIHFQTSVVQVDKNGAIVLDGRSMPVQHTNQHRAVCLSGPVSDADHGESESIYLSACEEAARGAAIDLENELHKQDINRKLGFQQ